MRKTKISIYSTDLGRMVPPVKEEEDEKNTSEYGSRNADRNFKGMNNQAGDDITDKKEQTPA